MQLEVVERLSDTLRASQSQATARNGKLVTLNFVKPGAILSRQGLQADPISAELLWRAMQARNRVDLSITLRDLGSD